MPTTYNKDMNKLEKIKQEVNEGVLHWLNTQEVLLDKEQRETLIEMVYTLVVIYS